MKSTKYWVWYVFNNNPPTGVSSRASRRARGAPTRPPPAPPGKNPRPSRPSSFRRPPPPSARAPRRRACAAFPPRRTTRRRRARTRGTYPPAPRTPRASRSRGRGIATRRRAAHRRPPRRTSAARGGDEHSKHRRGVWIPAPRGRLVVARVSRVGTQNSRRTPGWSPPSRPNTRAARAPPGRPSPRAPPPRTRLHLAGERTCARRVRARRESPRGARLILHEAACQLARRAPRRF